MYVETRGAGPALILLHGWAMHGGVFAPLAERLSARYTLHLVDLPGHGYSADSPLPLALDPVTDELAARIPDAIWLGWSMGGLFAQHAASRHRSAVRGLVMLCSSPRFVRAEDWRFGVPVDVFDGFAEGLRNDYRQTLDRFVALEAIGSEQAREQVRALRETLFARGQPSSSALVDGLALLAGTDLRGQLAGLGMPSLWLAGRRDRLVDPRAVDEAAAMTPEATGVRFEHAGHAPFLTHADLVVDAIEDFAAGLPA